MRLTVRDRETALQARDVLNQSCVGAWLTAVAFAGGVFSLSRLVNVVLSARSGC